MAITVVDEHTISVLSIETDGFGADFSKTYNFFGYVESDRIDTPSPDF